MIFYFNEFRKKLLFENYIIKPMIQPELCNCLKRLFSLGRNLRHGWQAYRIRWKDSPESALI